MVCFYRNVIYRRVLYGEEGEGGSKLGVEEMRFENRFLSMDGLEIKILSNI